MTRAALRALSLIAGNVAHSCFQWRIVTASCNLFGSTPLEGTRHGRGIKMNTKSLLIYLNLLTETLNIGSY